MKLVLGGNDEAYFYITLDPSGSVNLSVLDTRFLDSTLPNHSTGGIILSDLTIDDLRALHSWIGNILDAEQPALPGL